MLLEKAQSPPQIFGSGEGSRDHHEGVTLGGGTWPLGEGGTPVRGCGPVWALGHGREGGLTRDALERVNMQEANASARR